MAPDVAEEYTALVGTEQILQESYVEYLRKLKDAELALSLESAQQGAQLTRQDVALPPDNPVDWERVSRGLIGQRADPVIPNTSPARDWAPVAWDFSNWDFIEGDAPPDILARAARRHAHAHSSLCDRNSD